MAQKRKRTAEEVLESFWDDSEEDMDVSNYNSDEFSDETEDELLPIPGQTASNAVVVPMDIPLHGDDGDQHGDDGVVSSASEDDVPGPSIPAGVQVRGQHTTPPPVVPPPPTNSDRDSPSPLPADQHQISDSDYSASDNMSDNDDTGSESDGQAGGNLARRQGQRRGRGRGGVRGGTGRGGAGRGGVRGGAGRGGAGRGGVRGGAGRGGVRGGAGRGRGRGRGGRRAAVGTHDPPPGWSRNTASFTERVFTPNETPGPKNIPNSIDAESTPLDFFSLFWTDEIWNLLVDETNKQALHILANNPRHLSAKNIQKKPITLDEMKAFFGLRGTMEMLINKDRYAQYWRSKDINLTYTPGFPETMARDRFLAIWSCLHCVDENDATVDKTDKIYKSRPVFNIILENFQYYYVAYCHMSLDEGMIPTKNKLSFRQYIKDKPIRWGIKTFLLCDSRNGYICNAEVYTGRRDDATVIPDLGVTGNLVVRLCANHTGQNYSLYTDRYYTSVILVQYMLTNLDICMSGTAMTNRREFPMTLVRTANEMNRGEWDLFFNGHIACLVWQDKRPLYVVTSQYISSPQQEVLRYDPALGRRAAVRCPKAVQAYNNYMGGTDKNDQLTRLQRCRRHYKWPRRLMMKFFIWSCYNAYIIMDFYKPHTVPGSRTFTFHNFLEKLFTQLVGNTRTSRSAFGHRRVDAVVEEKRLEVNAHHNVVHPTDAGTNHRCVVCRKIYMVAKALNPGAQAKDRLTKKKEKCVQVQPLR